MKELDIKKVYNLRNLTPFQKRTVLRIACICEDASAVDFIEFSRENWEWYGFKTTDARELFNE